MPQISLEAARVNAKMTQVQAAQELGVSRQTVINWENGKTKIGTPQFAMLCSVYKMSGEFIFLPIKSTNSRTAKRIM